MQDPQFFIDMADECLSLVRASRQQADRLEHMAHDFMARAVELDTARDRVEKRNDSAE